MSSDSAAPAQPARLTGRLCAGIVVLLVATTLFSWAVARYHHPAFGFTRFLQLQESFAAEALPEVRHGRVYVYQNDGGYDGQFYAQLALRPALRDPALADAIDNPPMRARRILGSWIAAVVGAGDSDRTLHAYAALNIVGWFALGAVLLRFFPPHSLHNLVAWLGLMASCGALTSVRYALTDLPALLLLALALWRIEKHPPGFGAAGLMAAATLARETAVLAGAALLPGDSWKQRILRGLLLVGPMVLWLTYVRLTVGPEIDSIRNFDWPFATWLSKARLIANGFASPGPAGRYVWLDAACFVGLTVQLLFFVLRPRWRESAWQLGIGYVLLCVVLGWPTFEGFPGAYTRILLPLHLAFNRLVPATRRGLAILLLGNLSVFAGIDVLSSGGKIDHEYTNAVFDRTAYIATEGDGWFGIEQNPNHRWSWTSGEGTLHLRRFYPGQQPPAATGFLRIKLVGFIPAEVTIRHDEQVLWQGEAPTQGRFVAIPLTALTFDEHETAVLTLSSPTPPVPEAPNPDARPLCFAVFDLAFVAQAINE